MVLRIMLVIIAVQLAANLKAELNTALRAIRYQVPVSCPVREFAALRPYLGRVWTAGYLTCDHSDHPFFDVSIMAPYQSAQFFLSPTILDFNSLDHTFTIVKCDSVKRVDFMRRFPAFKIVYQNADMALIKRSLP